MEDKNSKTPQGTTTRLHCTGYQLLMKKGWWRSQNSRKMHQIHVSIFDTYSVLNKVKHQDYKLSPADEGRWWPSQNLRKMHQIHVSI